MRALALVTRFRDRQFEADYCLLAYDEPDLSGAVVSADVRDVLDKRPNTPWIFVAAPFASEHAVIGATLEGVSSTRAGGRAGGGIAALVLRRDAHGTRLAMVHKDFANPDAAPVETNVASELVQGWMFDLFDTRQCRVDAPPGVHFAKGSGRHSAKFLRTSATLVSSVACGLVALFALARLPQGQVRRLFVDTAPLISVAMAMQRIASLHGFWTETPPALSFSSYGGLDRMPSISKSDVFLISASTSGGLVAELIQRGANEHRIATLFFLQSVDPVAPENVPTSQGVVVCDLTARLGRPFGYSPLESQDAQSCTWCAKDWLLARLEGDQFMLEKRGVKRLRIAAKTQSESAKELLDLLAKRTVISVDLYRQSDQRTHVRLNVGRIVREISPVCEAAVRLLRKFTPSPLHRVVLVGLVEAELDFLIAAAGMERQFESAVRLDASNLETMDPVEHGGVLVLIGCLRDHARMRGINATLRVKAPQGVVSYISVVTIGESPKNFSDIRTFLGYGESGSETFVFRSAFELALPWLQDQPSAWDDELDLLRRLASDQANPMEPELHARLGWLEQASSPHAEIFLPGSHGALEIAADFVYLNTKVDRELISQADVLAVVENLLASVRYEASDSGGRSAIQWNRSVYGQVLVDPATLCPRNLRDYNDAVLRAAFLRGAYKAELDFSVDDEISAEVLDVAIADLAGWPEGRGDSLPELIMSMATERLRLSATHVARFKHRAREVALPAYLFRLLSEIPS